MIPLPTLLIPFPFLMTVLIVPLPPLGQLMLYLSLSLFDLLSFCFSALLLPLPDLYFVLLSLIHLRLSEHRLWRQKVLDSNPSLAVC